MARHLKSFDEFIGRVSPDEYDWKKQLLKIIQDANKYGQMFVTVDAGKLAGICEALEKFQKENSEKGGGS
jgi:hypothetical protein